MQQRKRVEKADATKVQRAIDRKCRACLENKLTFETGRNERNLANKVKAEIKNRTK